MEDMFNESIVNRLKLKHTSYTEPPGPSLGAIPYNTTLSGFTSHFGTLSAAGSNFASVNDLAAIGKAILNNELLSTATTNPWLKPRTFRPDVAYMVGAPWEIFRWETPARTYDLYTKQGSIGLYASLFVLVPDLDLGFTILQAGTPLAVESPTVHLLADLIAAELLPVAEDIARQQSNERFAGKYSGQGINSSLTVTTDSQPGLRVTLWINNGTDLLAQLVPPSDGLHADFRLWPNDVYSDQSDESGFTATWQAQPVTIIDSPFSTTCVGAFGGLETVIYCNVGIGQFVFDLDKETGEAKSVKLEVLRVRLDRSSA